ncbi:MAG: hypothetical protein LBV79_09865 [Candidatus Adiutrix sp.]|jgi:hypothetical protein|nr:hypothetical protein [Candidatus Adiutrix sp.]
MTDGRDQARWNDSPCLWCIEKQWCRKPPALPKCQRRLDWEKARRAVSPTPETGQPVEGNHET